MTGVGRAVFVVRSEALLSANWPAAFAGDHDAAQTCLAVLEDQSRFYEFGACRVASPIHRDL